MVGGMTNDIISTHNGTTVLDGDDAPDLSHFRAVHEAMRISNRQLVTALDEMSALDKSRAEALRRWFAGYTDELRMHHHIEDDICFPALAERVPAFVDYSSTLAGDHHRLDELIDALEAGLATLASFDGAEGDRQRSLALAVELRDFLLEHLALEDADVIPMFERHFTADQYREMDKRIMKEIKPAQALFTAPWFMATLDPEMAAKTLRAAPLPLRFVYFLGRRRYARLVRTAFGASATGGAS
jgi:hemerythrin-like domain-containing protein